MDRGIGAKQKILDAARDLFAERGIEDASLREIARSAGQGNTRAVQYHFEDRNGLLAAVLDPYHRRVDERRSALLDEIERQPNVAIRDAAGALVRPAAAMLEVEGGREYLRIAAEISREPARFPAPGVRRANELKRWRALATRLMSDDTASLHRRYAAVQFCHSELSRRATTRRRADHRLFVSDLVDLTTGILTAPVSDETKRFLAERDGKASESRS